MMLPAQLPNMLKLAEGMTFLGRTCRKSWTKHHTSLCRLSTSHCCRSRRASQPFWHKPASSHA